MTIEIGKLGEKLDLAKGFEAILNKDRLSKVMNGDIVKIKSSFNGEVFCRIVNLFFNAGEIKAMLSPILLPDYLPRPNDLVYKSTEHQIKKVLGLYGEGIKIGTVRHYPNIDVVIDMDGNLPIGVLGKTGSGKTQTAQLILGELAREGHTAVVLDPHGDYIACTKCHSTGKCEHNVTLAYQHPDKVIIHNPKDINPSTNVKKNRIEGKINIINLKDLDDDSERKAYVEFMISKFMSLAKKDKLGRTFLFIDEAHNFCPERIKCYGKAEIIMVAKEGRKFGLVLCIISQRPASVSKEALSQCHVIVVHKVTDRNDLNAVASSVEGLTNSDKANISRLGKAEAVVTGANLLEPVFTKITWRE